MTKGNLIKGFKYMLLLRSMRVILILRLPSLKLQRKSCVFSTLFPSPSPTPSQQASSLVHSWLVLCCPEGSQVLC